MLPSKLPIYCAATPVDLRRAFDGLAASAREALGKDPPPRRALSLPQQGGRPPEGALVRCRARFGDPEPGAPGLMTDGPDLKLSLFVMYSSVSGGLGSPALFLERG
jgi:hypothetical protein